MATRKKPKFAKGDRVKFSTEFIRSVQGHELAPLRGVVVDYLPDVGKSPKPHLDRVVIEWEEGDRRTAIVKNIDHAARITPA